MSSEPCSLLLLCAVFELPLGSVVMVSSLQVRTNSPGLGLYAASKSAIETLTKQWALEIALIRVNAVSPGLIETPGTSGNYNGAAKEKRAKAVPIGRVGEPSDIARLFLSCLRSSVLCDWADSLC